MSLVTFFDLSPSMHVLSAYIIIIKFDTCCDEQDVVYLSGSMFCTVYVIHQKTNRAYSGVTYSYIRVWFNVRCCYRITFPCVFLFFVSSCTHKCQFRNKMYLNTQLPRVRLSVGIFSGIPIIPELVVEGPSGAHVPQEGKPFLKIQPAQSHNKQNITLLICTLCMTCIVLRAPHRIQCFCCLREGAVLSRNVCAIRGFLFL
jgi:hypothetical protein